MKNEYYNADTARLYYLRNADSKKEYQREYRNRNGEAIREYDKTRYPFHLIYAKAWRNNNREYVRRYKKDYYLKNKEKCSQYNKKHYNNNKEKVKKQTNEYYWNNLEKCRETRRRYGIKQRLDNPDKVKEYQRIWQNKYYDRYKYEINKHRRNLHLRKKIFNMFRR